MPLAEEGRGHRPRASVMAEAAADGGSGGAAPHGSPAVVAAGGGRGAESPLGGGAGAAPLIAARKGQLRSAPRAKKLEKLGVYSACKVTGRPDCVTRGGERG